MPKKIIFAFLIFGISCTSYRKTDPLTIIITSNQSYKYDLSEGLYSVFYINKSPTFIKFHLNDNELKEIYDKYYSLNLDEIKNQDAAKDGIYIIAGKCNEMPADKTILQVQTEKIRQKIQINLDCNSFYLSNFIEAYRVKKFINFVLHIIRSKPDVKKAPSSDIWYM